jgi:hypothetical protein
VSFFEFYNFRVKIGLQSGDNWGGLELKKHRQNEKAPA